MLLHAAKQAVAMEQSGVTLSHWQDCAVSQAAVAAFAWLPDAPKSIAGSGISEIDSRMAAQMSLRTSKMTMDEPMGIMASGLPVHGQVTEAAQGFQLDSRDVIKPR